MNEPRRSPGDCRRFRFGVFEFDEQTLDLSKSGRAIPLRPQPLKLLALLLDRPGELVSRDSLQQALWTGDTFVDFDQGVNHAIRDLRAVLGDAAESPRFIQTLPRRGYRFIAPVQELTPAITAPAQIPDVETAALGTEAIAHVAAATPRRPLRVSWLVTAGVVAVIGAIAAGYAALGSSRGADPYAPAALVVRAFASPSDPALGIGIANAISARLGGQQSLSVRSGLERQAAGRAGGGQDGPTWPEGATHALDGEIIISGTDVDALARLQDAAGRTVWSDRIRVRADDLFSVEDVIAERVVAALRLRLAATEQDRMKRRYASSGAAYRDYLRGRAALVTYTQQGTREAIQAFESALRHDSGYVLARAGLAMACADMCLRFAPAAEVERWGERAETEARAALRQDADLAEAHLARAAVARKRDFDWNATVEASRRALALNPNLDQARFFVAAAYYHHGYMDESLIEMEKGRSLRGLDTIEPIRIDALVALFSGNFAPARARLEEVSRSSSRPIGDTYLALAYYYSGSMERGRAMLESLAESQSAATASRAGAALAGVLAAQREVPAARLQLERVLKREYRDHHVSYSLGAAYAQLGDAAAADQWLRTAANTGFPCLPFFERDPLLEPIRAQPAFKDLLAYVRARRDLSLSAGNR